MRAVLFDLFETLVSHFDPEWKPPVRTRAERLGVDERLWEAHWPRFERLWERGEIRGYEAALEAFCAAAGASPEASAVAGLRRDYRAITDVAFVPPPPAALVGLLSGLRARGLRLAIVTNANDLDTAPWATFALAPFFDAFVASHEVGLMKPDPRIYALACERLGVRPEDAVFVGDGGSDELRGAHEAGVRPLWCTWFLDRWPEGIRPNGFPGGEWRQRRAADAPFPRLAQPEDLLALL